MGGDISGDGMCFEDQGKRQNLRTVVNIKNLILQFIHYKSANSCVFLPFHNKRTPYLIIMFIFRWEVTFQAMGCVNKIN